MRTAAWLYIALGLAEGLERVTIAPYQGHIDNRIAPYWQDTPVAQIKPKAVEKYRDRPIQWIEANPALATEIVRRRREKKPAATPPTPDEIKAIVRATTPTERPYFGQAFIQTLLFAGLRPSEARAFRVSDLHPDAPPAYLRVSKRVDRWNAEGPPKSASGCRDVQIPRRPVAILAAWLKVKPQSKLGLVFPNGDGNYQSLANIHKRIWIPLQKKLGLTRPRDPRRVSPRTLARAKRKPDLLLTGKYDIKALRHAFASIEIDAGVDPKKLQEQMGHASFQMTMDTYGHLWKNRQRDLTWLAQIEAWIDAA